MKIRLAVNYLQSDSIVDGEGIRTVIWTQGCSHNCPGCHNPNTHSFDDGYLLDIKEVEDMVDELDGQDGVTFSGGDPFYQAESWAIIAKYIKKRGLNVWCYTGFLYETLIELSKKNSKIMDFLKEIDVLVDGPFLLEQKSYDAIFRGSTNQRIINVKKSLKDKKVVLVDKYYLKEKKIKEHIYI